MKYIYNRKGKFCGICFADTEKGTDSPVKPLRQGEKAIWNGSEWEYNFEELEEEENDFLNSMKNLFSESRKKEAKGLYNEEDFILIGDKEIPTNLENRTFDCAFLGRINFSNIEDFLREKSMVLRKEIWEEIKDMDELARMQTLFENYACFVVGGDFQEGEKASDDETFDMITSQDESVIDTFLSGNEIQNIFTQATIRMMPCGGNKTLPKEKDITVLIPCYNKAEYILETVKSAVKQTMLPYKVKVLLMDTESAALKSEIESLSSFVECEIHKRLNASAARNYLVKTCETEYFILLDADDTIDENFIESVYEVDASIVFPGWDEIDHPDWVYIRAQNSFFRDCVAQNLTSLLCKTAWNELGGLDEDLCSGGEDVDFIIRLFCKTDWKIQKIYKTCINYRRETEDSLTSNTKDFSTGHFKQLLKNKEIMREAIEKSYFYRDNFTTLFFDDSNFKSEKYLAFKFRRGENIYFNPPFLYQSVTFEMKKGLCNRKCDYCCQENETPYPEYDDDEVFDRFDKLLTKAEEITGGELKVNISGGEPTLWSDYLIQKILDRLSKYQSIMVLTNHDKKDSLWEKDVRVTFLNHLCDWQNMGRIDVTEKNRYMIVVTHDDVQYLEDFMRENSDTLISIDRYNASDDTKKLTDEDRKTIVSLAEKYHYVDPSWTIDFISEKYPYGEWTYGDGMEGRTCLNSKNTWRADCDAMTFCPCCGIEQSLISYEDFTGQKTNLEECVNCIFANGFVWL